MHAAAIRRLILLGPFSEEEARSATMVSEKMQGSSSERIEYRASPRTGRVLMYQADSISYFPTGRRRQHARLLDDAAGQALAVGNAAVVSGDPVFNVFTGALNPAHAYPGTDAVFTVGLPEGDAVAWFARIGGGIAPGIAVQCLSAIHMSSRLPWFLPYVEWCALRDGARFMFFKRKPVGWQRGEAIVLNHARALLAEVSGVPAMAASSRP